VSPGLENIPQVSVNRAILAQNHDAHKALSSTLSVLRRSGAIFRPRSSTPGVRFVNLCPFHCELRPSGVILESPGLQNIPQLPINTAKVAQNYHARRAVLATP